MMLTDCAMLGRRTNGAEAGSTSNALAALCASRWLRQEASLRRASLWSSDREGKEGLEAAGDLPWFGESAALFSQNLSRLPQ